jgi:hypothetical protein
MGVKFFAASLVASTAMSFAMNTYGSPPVAGLQWGGVGSPVVSRHLLGRALDSVIASRKRVQCTVVMDIWQFAPTHWRAVHSADPTCHPSDLDSVL